MYVLTYGHTKSSTFKSLYVTNAVDVLKFIFRELGGTSKLLA